MAGVYCPNCGKPVLGFNRVTPHESECGNCQAQVKARWDGHTMEVRWTEKEYVEEEEGGSNQCPQCGSENLLETGWLTEKLYGDALRCLVCKKWFARSLIKNNDC